MKKYQHNLGLYLVSRRAGNHVVASELARAIRLYWQSRGNESEEKMWKKVQEMHLNEIE